MTSDQIAELGQTGCHDCRSSSCFCPCLMVLGSCDHTSYDIIFMAHHDSCPLRAASVMIQCLKVLGRGSPCRWPHIQCLCAGEAELMSLHPRDAGQRGLCVLPSSHFVFPCTSCMARHKFRIQMYQRQELSSVRTMLLFHMHCLSLQQAIMHSKPCQIRREPLIT